MLSRTPKWNKNISYFTTDTKMFFQHLFSSPEKKYQALVKFFFILLNFCSSIEMQSSFLNFDQFLRYRSISYKFGSQDWIYPEKWNKYKSYKKNNILLNSNLQILIFLIYLKKGFQVCTTLVLFWFFFCAIFT